jgi:hypothetical protein
MGSMTIWRNKPLPDRLALVGPLAFAVILVGSTGSDARARKIAHVKTVASAKIAATMPQQKPVKLRYYGGPKSPMYPE